MDEVQTYFDYTEQTLTATNGDTYTGYPDLQCSPTDYAVARGAWQNDYYTTADGVGCCWWWLRSPGSDSDFAADVLHVGWLNYDYFVSDVGGAVRPALWVTIS